MNKELIRNTADMLAGVLFSYEIFFSDSPISVKITAGIALGSLILWRVVRYKKQGK